MLLRKQVIQFQVPIIVCLVLTACATGPTSEEIASADYGPKPENPQSVAEEWIKERLIDPESARFDHLPLRQGYSRLMGAGTEFGWVQCGTVNAKNRMGGYTGRQQYFVTIRNGVVVQGYVDSPTSEYVKPAQNVCEGIHGQ